MSAPKKHVDLEEVIKSKNKTLAKWMPRFVLNYIKGIVHEDEINAGMNQIGHLQSFDFADAVIDFFKVTVKVEGLENIPANGGSILAANHPLGALDGIAFIKAVGQKRSDLKFLVNDILMSFKQLGTLFLPINKHGVNPRESLKLIDKAYASDELTLVFPAGLVSRKLKGGIADLKWHKSFISKAIRHQKEVIPVHIQGKNSNFFYNLSKIRTAVGVKANIEMFYLADEMFRQAGKTITITFGEPIPYTVFDRSKSQSQWAEYVREKVYQLAK